MDRKYTMLPQFIIKGEDILNRIEVLFEGKFWIEEGFIGDNNEKYKFYYILLEDIQSILPDTYYIVLEVNRDRFDYTDTPSFNTNDGYYIVNKYLHNEIIFKSYIYPQPLKNLEEKINAEINIQALQDFRKDLTLEEIEIVIRDITENCLPLFRKAFDRCNALKRLNEG